MNLACRNRLRTSFFRRPEFGDEVKKSLPKTIPSPPTTHSNMTQASRWPFWNKASTSIRFTSDPGPEPICAGRRSGNVSACSSCGQTTRRARTTTVRKSDARRKKITLIQYGSFPRVVNYNSAFLVWFRLDCQAVITISSAVRFAASV